MLKSFFTEICLMFQKSEAIFTLINKKCMYVFGIYTNRRFLPVHLGKKESLYLPWACAEDENKKGVEKRLQES